MGPPDARALQRPFRADPTRSAVLTDFDGTLAPIVDDPTRAVALPGSTTVLQHLVEVFGVVGVISGRPVRFLVERLGGIRGLHLAGLYGLEQAVGDHVVVHPEARQWLDQIEAAARDAEASAPAGVLVERKGLAVTLHVRTVPAHAAWIAAFGARQATSRGLQAHAGRQSMELRPPIGVDKGTVVAELSLGCRAICYCGDDVGDLPAFAVLARLRAEGAATLAVAALSDESPPELAAAVDVTVAGPQGVLRFLSELADPAD